MTRCPFADCQILLHQLSCGPSYCGRTSDTLFSLEKFVIFFARSTLLTRAIFDSVADHGDLMTVGADLPLFIFDDWVVARVLCIVRIFFGLGQVEDDTNLLLANHTEEAGNFVLVWLLRCDKLVSRCQINHICMEISDIRWHGCRSDHVG